MNLDLSLLKKKVLNEAQCHITILYALIMNNILSQTLREAEISIKYKSLKSSQYRGGHETNFWKASLQFRAKHEM